MAKAKESGRLQQGLKPSRNCSSGQSDGANSKTLRAFLTRLKTRWRRQRLRF